MLTQENIEERNFTYWATSQQSVTNDRPGRVDYVGVGIINKGKKLEVRQLLMLSYDDNGYLTLTDYFNNPIYSREYYLGYQQITTEDELDEALASTIWEEIEDLDMDELYSYA